MLRRAAFWAGVAVLATALPAAAANGSVSGTVTNSADGTALSGVRVTLYNASSGATVGSAITDAGGAYTISNVPTGTYNASTVNTQGFIDQIYSGIVCPTCLSATGGTSITVTAPNTTAHIDFALAAGGRIAGTIKDQSGNPITSGAYAKIYNNQGTFVTTAPAGTGGAYLSGTGLPAGTYFVASNNTLGDGDTLYNAIACTNCPVVSGTPITVTAGSTTSGIDLTLAAAGSLSGHVQTAEGSSPIFGVDVAAWGTSGFEFKVTFTDASGNYSITGLPPGTYWVTADIAGRIDQIYNGKVFCADCSSSLGTPITVSAGTNTPGIDFALALGASVTGTITDATTHAGVAISVLAVSASGIIVNEGASGPSGTYTVDGLPPGSYYIETGAFSGYVNQVHGSPSNVSCPANVLSIGCPVVFGTPITVTGTATVSGVDFALQPTTPAQSPGTSAAIKGTVMSGGTPLVGVKVMAFAKGNSFSPSGTAFTDSTGAYTIPSMLPGGYIVKTSNTLGYVDQVYNGRTCEACTPAAGDVVTVASATDATNVNFTLAAGGTITGRVADTSGNPIPGASIQVETRDGLVVGSATTGPDGRYVSSALLTGQYVVAAETTSYYISQMYNGISCPGCAAANATLVSVTSGATATNIDFALPVSGTISGTITDTNGSPLSGITVSAGFTFTTTNAVGHYVLLGVQPGSQTVQTTNTQGYINQTSAAVVVTQGGTITGVDFHLAAGGTIAGVVTTTGGLPLQEVLVDATGPSGTFAAFTLSDGSYAITGVPVGTSFVYTSNSWGYVDVVHASPSDIPCLGFGCPAAQVGSGVSVTQNQTATVNFTLAAGGAISGTVTDTSNAPIAGVTVTAAAPGFNFDEPSTSTTTASDGTYTMIGLPAGPYAVSTSNSSGHLDQVYNGHACNNCNTATGDVVAVTAGATRTGVNFALASGASISGTVTDATGAPIPGATVQAFNASGTQLGSASTNNLGAYTIAGLPDGTYSLSASSSYGYVSASWPGHVTIQGGVTTPSAVNFTLSAGGRISGRITDAATGAPLAATVEVFSANGGVAGYNSSNASGFYGVDGLAPGTYYIEVFGAAGYITALYGNPTCFECSMTAGTPITVGAGAETSGINVALSTGGTVSGSATDAATGKPIGGLFIDLLDAHDDFVGFASTNASGHYTFTSGVPTGTYYAVTSNASSLGYADLIYSGIPCFVDSDTGCPILTGTPISITAGATTPNINFVLSAAGRLTGRVTSGGVGAPNVEVDLDTPGGIFVDYTITGMDGSYGISGIPAGTYVAASFSSTGLVDQVYSGKTCVGQCALASGTPITVSPGATTSNIDFDLSVGGRISGRVTDSATGSPMYGTDVFVYNTAGQYVAFGFTDYNGSYLTYVGMPAGTYFVTTFSPLNLPFSDAHIQQVYSAIPCAPCSPTSGTPVTVTAGAITPNINFALATGSQVTGTITDASTGLPIWGVEVDVYDAQGREAAAGTTNEDGQYSTGGLLAGTYFVRTVAGSGHVDALYNTGVCLACDVTRGTPLVLDGSSTASGIDFALMPGGRVSGTITASAGGAPIGDATVRFYNSSGALLGHTATNAAGTYTSPALPAGTYYVRTANTVGYVDKLYDTVTCAPCAFSQGTRVTVVTAGVKSGIDFSLDQGGTLSGYVSDASTGMAIVGATVSIFDDATRALVAVTDQTDSNGGFLISLPAGTYDLQANPIDGYRPVVSTQRGQLALTTGIVVTAGGQTSAVGIALAECSALSVGPTSLPLATAGQPYSASLTASGGTAPYGFSVIDGALPTGVTLGSDGTLTGTPQAAGAASFTVAAADATQCGGTRAMTLTTCSFFLATSAASTTWIPGTGSVSFTASTPACAWTAASNVPWITITSGIAGTGSGSISFAVTSNPTGGARTGTISVAGQTYTVVQSAPQSQAPFGYLDTPANGATGLFGAIAITGWALDDVQVTRVTLCRDWVAGESAVPLAVCGGQPKIYIGDAVFVDGVRPDVAARYPALPFNTRAGWGYLLLSNLLPNQGNGPYTFYAYAFDGESHTTLLGSATVSISNATAVKPFGTIDTPAQGATISGTAYANFGWALAHTPASIPTDGSTLAVYLDGAPAGSVDYNLFRPDIPTLFPGLANSNGAVGVHVFDTTTLANGIHTIVWTVTDSAGQVEALGSRYFSVFNPLASQRAPTLVTDAARVATEPSFDQTRSDAALPLVQFRTTLDDGALLALPADPDGTRPVTLGQLDRLTLRFNNVCGPVTGQQRVDDAAAPLPVGSTLDPTGTFYWHPGPAFLGTYHLTFTVPTCAAGSITVPVDVTIVAR